MHVLVWVAEQTLTKVKLIQSDNEVSVSAHWDLFFY